MVPGEPHRRWFSCRVVAEGQEALLSPCWLWVLGSWPFLENWMLCPSFLGTTHTPSHPEEVLPTGEQAPPLHPLPVGPSVSIDQRSWDLSMTFKGSAHREGIFGNSASQAWPPSQSLWV